MTSKSMHSCPDRKGDDGLWLKTWRADIDGSSVVHQSRSYHLWRRINNRCRPGGAFQKAQPTYIGVTNGFESYQAFAEWCNSKAGYMAKDHAGMFYEIDKDILIPGNKAYSPEACSFIPRRINSLLAINLATRGCLPLGVSFMKHRNKFRAAVRSGNRSLHLGMFHNPNEAHKAWQIEKSLIIRKEARDYDLMPGACFGVLKSLIKRADTLLSASEAGTETLEI